MTSKLRAIKLAELANLGWTRLHEVYLDGIRCWDIYLDRPVGNTDYLPRVVINADTGDFLKWSIKDQKWLPRIVPQRFVNVLINNAYNDYKNEGGVDSNPVI